METKSLHSGLDSSVNFVEAQLVGFLESRYVRKCDNYFICYLSSQTGCNRGCRFCHLTVTGQTSFTDTTHNDFIGQALQVFKHYRNLNLGARHLTPAKWMHYNFMARGEPLANRTLLDSATELLYKLGQIATDEGVPPKFNMSTIMPISLDRSLVDVFPVITPTIYYSLYSVKDEFRRKWMPASMPAQEALRLLREYQIYSKKIVKIHSCFIEGENDDWWDVAEMCDALETNDITYEFNLVRYNPASAEQGRESDWNVIHDRLTYIRARTCRKVQIIPRVGYDVQASCGMFVKGDSNAVSL